MRSLLLLLTLAAPCTSAPWLSLAFDTDVRSPESITQRLTVHNLRTDGSGLTPEGLLALRQAGWQVSSTQPDGSLWMTAARRVNREGLRALWDAEGPGAGSLPAVSVNLECRQGLLFRRYRLGIEWPGLNLPEEPLARGAAYSAGREAMGAWWTVHLPGAEPVKWDLMSPALAGPQVLTAEGREVHPSPVLFLVPGAGLLAGGLILWKRAGRSRVRGEPDGSTSGQAGGDGGAGAAGDP